MYICVYIRVYVYVRFVSNLFISFFSRSFSSSFFSPFSPPSFFPSCFIALGRTDWRGKSFLGKCRAKRRVICNLARRQRKLEDLGIHGDLHALEIVGDSSRAESSRVESRGRAEEKREKETVFCEPITKRSRGSQRHCLFLSLSFFFFFVRSERVDLLRIAFHRGID